MKKTCSYGDFMVKVTNCTNLLFVLQRYFFEPSFTNFLMWVTKNSSFDKAELENS